ncbi:MAG: hypothetical protein MJZ70_05275 [Bacteroidales bacterium]|nr:hypothetical protein [Bacteroidales bacterium]
MKEGLKDLLRLIIVVVVLCVFVYIYPEENPETKRELYYGVVGGGMTAFLVFFIIKAIRDNLNKKK